MTKEEKDMQTTAERLAEANRKFDSIKHLVWKEAEQNLLDLENEYKHKTEGSEKTDKRD